MFVRVARDSLFWCRPRETLVRGIQCASYDPGGGSHLPLAKILFQARDDAQMNDGSGKGALHGPMTKVLGFAVCSLSKRRSSFDKITHSAGEARLGAGEFILSIDDSSSEILYPEWQNEYEAALEEQEPAKLKARIEAAEAAIYNRLQQISQNSDHHTERHVIEDALTSLRTMQRDVLGFPDWKKKK